MGLCIWLSRDWDGVLGTWFAGAGHCCLFLVVDRPKHSGLRVELCICGGGVGCVC